ncbi:hypothetical protein DID74_02085 [Candidatus Marinamargulisbacteria bacterium SCGC AG-333-B06]|nr:hypothetical protein DID74_02085 [Candidatus Marinamargulisbacteria bacterium SCGC AG-333-B06]
MTLLKLIYSIYAWSLTVTIFILHYLITNLIMLFPFKKKSTIFYKLANFFLKSAFFMGAVRVKVHGKENFPLNHNGVVISNHQSLLDVVILMAFLPQRIVFFAKKELNKIPVLSYDMKHMEHVLVDRNKKSSALLQLKTMEERLHNNLNAFIFPEGTRSDTGEIKPFKRGAFHLAASAKKPIIPCYIHGSMNLLKKNQKLFLPGVIHLAIGKPISDSYTDSTKEVSKRLQAKSQQAVKDLQDNLIRDLS